MTFTTRIKEEVTSNIPSDIDARILLISYLKYATTLENDRLKIYIENANVARYIFKLIKITYNIDINLTIRTQKKFKIKKIFILSIKDKIDIITNDIKELNRNIIDSSYEEIVSFLRGTFLCTGSINDPSKSKYHLGFLVDNKNDADLINSLLIKLKFNSKVIRRDKGYMVYIKVSEEISDFIKLLGATNSLFYYEDIRIYRDHKNMTNRLNNCEQANMDKVFMTANKQIKDIEKLYELDVVDLLDEKLKTVIEYRMKYKESSLKELAEIMSLETGMEITKSGLNHRFRKIKEILDNIENK